MEAHLVKGLLEANGITAEVHGENLFNVRGEVAATWDTLPTVWVLDDVDTTRALGLLVEYQRRDPPATIRAADWICRACGERIEDQFTECWNCGAERVAS